MNDFAFSEDPEVQRQLDRLSRLSIPQGRLGLETIRALLARLGNPHFHLPPCFHIAGTNGKGSTAAYLRAMLEAQGLKVHCATSPHLVRYNERIRVAGQLIDDASLARLLARVLDAGSDLSPSFFEATIAATFLAFSETPADACVIEVGLGGRFDATNVLPPPLACGIASLGIDHERFLLVPEDGTPDDPLARIAFEKAGIAKAGSALVTQAYPPEATAQILRQAKRAEAPVAMRGQEWIAHADGRLLYRDAAGSLELPVPTLAGAHQADNAALAVAMLRHQSRLKVTPEAMARGIASARWPARLQPLGPGPLTALVPGRAVWLDGGHNADAGRALAGFFGPRPGKLHLVLGMLEAKDPAGLVKPLADRLLSVTVVPVPGHDAHPASTFAGHVPLPVSPAGDVAEALRALPPGGDILIAGSLYLAGEVLRLNAEIPD